VIQQLAVICALSSGATATEAADQAGVHRNTISNWRRNALPFQYAFAHAQYDRALFYREKAEALADLAIQTIQQILTDPNAPAGVRLKAALTILQTASTPPEPKKQVSLDIEKIKIVHNPEPQVLDPLPKPQNLVAVGMPVAQHPPHRSVRAEFPHTALILDE
jgi:transposase-like protein